MKNYIFTALVLLTSSSLVMAKDDARSLSYMADSIAERNAYHYEFNRDEQCQNYDLGIKRLGLKNPCVKVEEIELEPIVEVEITEEAPIVFVPKIDVLNEYIIYFGFDESIIRDQEKAIIEQAASEIQKYNPSQVLVAGYTDTRGTVEYNDKLAATRASNVSDYLTNLGVSNSNVNQESMGESDLAVETDDEVKKAENRRVIIQFVR